MTLHLARSLSIGAVLAATSVVGGNAIVSRGSPAAASATSSTASTPGSGSTEASSASTNPGTAVASTPASTVPVTPTPVAGSTTQFSVVAGDAATLILDTSGGVLRIVAFAPHPGWFTVRLEQPSSTDVRAELETETSRTRFTARLDGGAIAADVVVDSTTSSGPGSGAPDGSAPDAGPGSSSSTSVADDSSTSSTSSTSLADSSSSSSTSSPGDTAPDDDDGDDNSGPGGGDDSSGSGSG